MTTKGQCSQLVATLYGVGFWDAINRELRLPHGVHVSPEPRCMTVATETEARDFFATRSAVRAELSAFYAAPGDKGD